VRIGFTGPVKFALPRWPKSVFDVAEAPLDDWVSGFFFKRSRLNNFEFFGISLAPGLRVLWGEKAGACSACRPEIEHRATV
jgi:hypothetical protein